MNKPILTVKNLNKTINSQTILSDISFTIEQRSLVSLIGPNGAGKSTLIKILLGFDTKYNGEVHINSNERFEYIPQILVNNSSNIPISVKEYIFIGTTPLYNKKSKGTCYNLYEVLEHVGVSSKKLDQSFWSLSGGERQRVAIARALLSNPTVLVLDEPLSAVDYASRDSLYKLIRHLQQDHQITVILVSHDVDSILPISDRVLCLNTTLHTDCHPHDYHDSILENKSTSIHHHC